MWCLLVKLGFDCHLSEVWVSITAFHRLQCMLLEAGCLCVRALTAFLGITLCHSLVRFAPSARQMTYCSPPPPFSFPRDCNASNAMHFIVSGFLSCVCPDLSSLPFRVRRGSHGIT